MRDFEIGLNLMNKEFLVPQKLLFFHRHSDDGNPFPNSIQMVQ